MRKLLFAVAAALIVVGASSAAHPDDDGVVEGQHGGVGGHLPASSLNVELVGKLRVHDATPGIVADVATFRSYAYLNQFSPGCAADGAGGVYIIDISNPASPTEVGFITSPAGSFPGEGAHVMRLDTASFAGDLLAVNQEVCATGGRGGFSLYDVTNPLALVTLVESFGDPTPGFGGGPNRYHSVFAWQQAGRAYLVASDDEEQGSRDIDIYDVSDPRNPALLRETGRADWPGLTPTGRGNNTFNHDMVVEKVGNTWTLLSSYWDLGYVKLNVNDPANPVFIGHSRYAAADPEFAGFAPEGNGHYAQFDRKGRFIIGTDEDFSPSELRFRITAPEAIAGQFPATEGTFTRRLLSLPGQTLAGEVVHVGRGCPAGSITATNPADPYLADPAGKIALIERGACRFDNKIAWAQVNGAVGAVVYNSGPGLITMGGDTTVTQPATSAVVGTTITIPGVFVLRTTGLALAANPGATVDMSSRFDGWGYIHLFDATTLAELDTYVVPDAAQAANAIGAGTMSVHEVEFDHNADLAYLAWYDAGFRVVRYGSGGLEEVGHFIDEGGNDFWGVEHTTTSRGQDIILASDRDSGLYIFKYTGPR